MLRIAPCALVGLGDLVGMLLYPPPAGAVLRELSRLTFFRVEDQFGAVRAAGGLLPCNRDAVGGCASGFGIPVPSRFFRSPERSAGQAGPVYTERISVQPGAAMLRAIAGCAGSCLANRKGPLPEQDPA